MGFMDLFRNADRTWKNNDSDGETYYGYDDETGYTTWYNRDGQADSRTPTPTDEEQEQNDAGY